MGNNQTEKAFEEKRLAQTISLAEEQLKQAKEAADKKKSEIIEAKKDVRENTEHGITSLYTSDGFEALVELSQYINPVTDKIIDYEEEEHKILLLEKMIKSPYFARIDFKFDDEKLANIDYENKTNKTLSFTFANQTQNQFIMNALFWLAKAKTVD